MNSLKLKLIIGIVGLFLSSFGITNNIHKKARKEVQKVLGIENFELSPVSLPDNAIDDLPTTITNQNFYRILRGSEKLGFVFVDQAPSKTAKFDYMVVFDSQLKIIHTKVLAYREEYGGEIGSKRWLKQFLGKTIDDRVDHETNIDGIAGATISVRSMTNAIDNLLQTITVLQSNNQL